MSSRSVRRLSFCSNITANVTMNAGSQLWYSGPWGRLLLWALVRVNENVKSSLKESRFVFRLIVVSKLDLALVSGELTGLVKGDRVGTIQDVITGLEYKN